MTKMNPVVHFEMPYVDAKRVSEFYKKVFGWEMQQYGEEMGNYIVATTSESDEKGPKKPGSINGGLFPKSDDPGRNISSFVISVDDIKQAMEEVKAAGGKIIGEIQDIKGVGKWVVFIDTEGNRCSLMQPNK